MSEYVVVFERAEDGGWGAYLPDLMRGRNLVAVFAGLLASCGGADDALVPRTGELAATLRVSVKPEGPTGPERVRRVQCAGLGEDAIDPRCRVRGALVRAPDQRDGQHAPRAQGTDSQAVAVRRHD